MNGRTTSPRPIPVVRKGPAGPGSGSEKPPGPPAIPLIGAPVVFRRDPLAAFEEVVRDYGDVVCYPVGRNWVYLVSHPDDIAQMLVAQHEKFVKGALTRELSRFLGQGLLTSEGTFWRRQRKIAAPSFTRRHIETFADIMVDCSVRARSGIAQGPRDVHADMMALTLQIVLNTVFGTADVSGTHAVGSLVEVLMHEYHHMFLTWRRLLPASLMLASGRRLDRARRALDVIFYGIIRERREHPAPAESDLLGRLLAARDDDGLGMTDVQVRDEVATLFLAGHETTALALSFTLLLLAQHPDVQAKVQAEVDDVVGSRRPTMTDVASLPWVDAVVREALRLYPPAYVFGREAVEDVRIGGWLVPRGAQVLAPVWTIHRDERWYPEPLAFRPERWLDGLAERLPRYTYLPFGGGARVCLGNHFAMLEVVLVLASLVQTLEVSPLPETEVDLLTSVTLRPRRGVLLRVSRRAERRG